MIDLSEMEKDLLMKIYSGRGNDQALPYWRVVVRAAIEQPPVEVGGNSESGLSWLTGCKDMNEALLRVQRTKMKFQTTLAEYPSLTIDRFVEDEIFLRMGYVVATTDLYYQKADALEYQKALSDHGLESLLIFTAPDKPDALLENLKKQPVKQLVEKGLAVQVSGGLSCNPWKGVCLTKAGYDVINQAILPEKRLEKQGQKTTKKSYLIRCTGCKKIYHRTTDAFNPDEIANGSMFELLPKYRTWGPNWGAHVRFEALTCPDCEFCYVDGKGKLRPGVLVDPEPETTKAGGSADAV